MRDPRRRRVRPPGRPLLRAGAAVRLLHPGAAGGAAAIRLFVGDHQRDRGPVRAVGAEVSLGAVRRPLRDAATVAGLLAMRGGRRGAGVGVARSVIGSGVAVRRHRGDQPVVRDAGRRDRRAGRAVAVDPRSRRRQWDSARRVPDRHDCRRGRSALAVLARRVAGAVRRHGRADSGVDRARAGVATDPRVRRRHPGRRLLRSATGRGVVGAVATAGCRGVRRADRGVQVRELDGVGVGGPVSVGSRVAAGADRAAGGRSRVSLGARRRDARCLVRDAVRTTTGAAGRGHHPDPGPRLLRRRLARGGRVRDGGHRQRR